MKLSQLQHGQVAVVSSVSALAPETRKKLMVMGLLPHTEIMVVRCAPLGDPLQVQVRDVNIALRKSIAAEIEVEVVKA
ncbi:hypothetical protein VST7929_01748 [Vibrio stylophorae]|uniref:Ferrous iron transporter FeoA-like domain-containing protein n=1 Tax=Vibrio stylophorae TaxID=659351 RepID=A0ABM8ZU72_9VIBR|nr:FeoA family protein [Vibrio stylophorae]CAH0533872.1 hypothetical protein VST7929_01748 [Vibrio stylophorae]